MLYYPSERKLKVLNHAFSELDHLLTYAHLTPVDRSSRNIYYLAEINLLMQFQKDLYRYPCDIRCMR